MPIYVYEVISENGEGLERFEFEQPMAEPPLKVHPVTGKPVRRVFLPPAIARKHAPMKSERTLSDDRKLERLGFTKYVKTGEATYEKTLGKGPKRFRKK